MILCWGEGHGSAIHDHADSHCFMKMLKGELREIRYAWPKNNSNCIEMNGMADISNQKDDETNTEYNGSEIQEISRAIMETNSVHYINGKYILPFINSFPFLDLIDKTKKNFFQNSKNLNFQSVIFFRNFISFSIHFSITKQTRLDYIALRIPAMRTVLFHCICTVHHTIHVRYLIKKPENNQNAPSNFTANMVNDDSK